MEAVHSCQRLRVSQSVYFCYNDWLILFFSTMFKTYIMSHHSLSNTKCNSCTMAQPIFFWGECIFRGAKCISLKGGKVSQLTEKSWFCIFFLGGGHMTWLPLVPLQFMWFLEYSTCPGCGRDCSNIACNQNCPHAWISEMAIVIQYTVCRKRPHSLFQVLWFASKPCYKSAYKHLYTSTKQKINLQNYHLPLASFLLLGGLTA